MHNFKVYKQLKLIATSQQCELNNLILLGNLVHIHLALDYHIGF